MPARVTVVGSTNLDMVIKTRRIPRPGETVIGGDFHMVPGGKGANQAVAAARMGAEVFFVARVGAGPLGDQALSGFKAEGIKTDFVRQDPEAAHGVALVLVEADGENAIAVAPGANARLTPEDVDRAESAIRDSDVVLLQLEVPIAVVERAVELAARHGRKVVLNPAPYAPLPESILSRVDYLTPNETEAERLLGSSEAGMGGIADTAEELIRRGVRCVIVTMGREGVFVVDESAQYHVPGRRVRAIDTTAAGDAFSGALSTWIGEGLPFREAVRRSIAASAICVTRLGAQPSLPTRAEVEEMLGE